MFGLFNRREVRHPAPVINRERVEPIHLLAAFPVGSLREAPTTRRELAPQPIPTSMFDTIGKRAPEIIRPVTSLAFAEWQGVAGWPFSVGRPLTPMRIPIAPHQGQNPFAEGVNVNMLPQTTLGAQTAITAIPYTGPQYGKLGVF